MKIYNYILIHNKNNFHFNVKHKKNASIKLQSAAALRINFIYTTRIYDFKKYVFFLLIIISLWGKKIKS